MCLKTKNQIEIFRLLSDFQWSGKRDSNSWPSAWEADALPTELLPQVWNKKDLLSSRSKVLDFWAENETRTRDPNLGKVMLYQLSYFRK